MQSTRSSHPCDDVTLSGVITVEPPLDSEQIELLATVAISSLRAALEQRTSTLVDQLVPDHPAGPSGWLGCENGCCLVVDDRGLAHIDAVEPWLRYIVGTLLVDHDLSGALMIFDHADGSFRALTVEGTQVRRRSVLQSERRGKSRKASSRARPLASV